MRRALAIATLALATGIPGAAAAPQAAPAPVQPTRVAVIIMENKAYSEVVGDTADAPYINGTVLPEALSLAPSSPTCDYVQGDPQGTGTEACTAGMFQSRRVEGGFRAGNSAAEYAWMVMGTDANVLNAHLPDCVPGTKHCPPTTDPNGGVVGYAPGGDPSDPPYNLFRVLENAGDPFTVYAEDYPGDASTCSTDQWSDPSAPMHEFYARKHNPFLVVWDQSPDAAVTPGITPSSPPSDAECRAHMRNFPHNVQNTLDQATNFDGTQSFGPVTFIVPSLCHDMHNPTKHCEDVPDVGGVTGGDTWLANNLPGIQKDVGSTGVVVITWDEGNSDDAGTVSPMPTFILPGVGGSGTAGRLAACPSGGCVDDVHLYDQSSTARALLAAVGAGCATLDDSVSYIGQGSNTAQSYCKAATPLPLLVLDPAAGSGAG
ncbi:MAG TPA: hypothetical protein VE777_18810 [Gaiellales bacterium]|jgi:hypothetical protein|nr:hypothetical protein [Gaiellales bacterium]